MGYLSRARNRLSNARAARADPFFIGNTSKSHGVTGIIHRFTESHFPICSDLGHNKYNKLYYYGVFTKVQGCVKM